LGSKLWRLIGVSPPKKERKKEGKKRKKEKKKQKDAGQLRNVDCFSYY